MKSRVTLRDLADAAGVHYSTISLALRDHPRISGPIRLKIKKLAEEMGYSPDPALSALNAYRKTKLPVHYQSTLAWIDNWKGPIKLRDQATFNDYYLGAQQRAKQLGYELEEYRMEIEKTSPERASKILQSRGIKGLLLAPQPEAGTQLPFDFEWFSTITFGYSLKPRVFHLVTNHQFHSMTLALEKLVEFNYKRIGLFIHQDIDDKVDNAYSSGFWQFFRKHSGLKCAEPCLVPPQVEDHALFLKWVRKERPDVIVSIGGLGIIDWLGEINFKVPQDVGYVRLSVSHDEAYFSGIYENGKLIGSTAVDFLTGMLQRGELGYPEIPIRILVEGSWISGQTIRRC